MREKSGWQCSRFDFTLPTLKINNIISLLLLEFLEAHCNPVFATNRPCTPSRDSRRSHTVSHSRSWRSQRQLNSVRFTHHPISSLHLPKNGEQLIRTSTTRSSSIPSPSCSFRPLPRTPSALTWYLRSIFLGATISPVFKICPELNAINPYGERGRGIFVC